ncbi:MAG: hypothetical protein MK102_13370 [Fuerstiella sp.]|nr:hypothetical protein [Fuerstiella sp.]
MWRTTDHVAVACGLLHQTVCGYAVFLPFIRLSSNEGNTAVVPMHSALLSACLLIAAGASFPLHSKFCRTLGLHTTTRISLMTTAAGIIVITVSPVPWIMFTGCLLTGFGSFGEWTPSAEMTRRSLSSTHLWRGMRIHSALFYIGALFAILTAASETISVFGMSAIMTLTCGALITCVRPARTLAITDSPSIPDHEIDAICSPGSATSHEERQHALASPPITTTDMSTTDVCESEDCCSVRPEWTPTPVWLGTCIACVGVYTVFAFLPDLVSGVTWPFALLVTAGGLFGTFIFQAVVPATGYAVLLVPVCIAGILSYGIEPWVPVGLMGPLLICQGAVAAAIWCGCSGLVGESFVDSCQYNSRTIVLMMGCMAAACVGLMIGAGETIIPAVFASSINGLVCLITILLLRKIPSLVLSQRREDEISPRDAERMLSESFGTVGGPAE